MSTEDPGLSAEDRELRRLIESAGVPSPTSQQTASLIVSLEKRLARPGPNWATQLTGHLSVARAQLAIFPIAFWFVSVAVMLVGVGLIALGLDPSRSLIFYLMGPLLGFIGMEGAFSAASARVLEIELATPISPRRLTFARLVVMLGYEVMVGALLTGALWLLAGGALLALTLTWLMPLFVTSGLTLALSARLPVYRAASLIYGVWTISVLLGWRLHGPDISLGVPLEAALAAAGLILIVSSVLIFNPVANLLPRRHVTTS